MERNKRRTYEGRVVSDANDKTIIVEISTRKIHPLYGKRVKYTKRLTAHDEHNDAKINDLVELMETRPLSKTKRFRLTRVIEKAVVL